MQKLFILLLSALPFAGNAQQFIVKGKIEFERKINVHKQFEGDGDFTAQLKKTIPQYNITYFDFYFDGNQSLYKPGRENPANRGSNMFFGGGVATENIVYNNYESQQFTSQKAVFENTYLIHDSLRKMEWKMTTDTRKIAGFNCRKATGIMNDSVFVFAFFTEEIIVPGGPEGFNGLPGMILGIAIPRVSTTWFATKLELVEVTPKNLAPPTKGKKTDLSNLNARLKESMKDWGKWGERHIWTIMF